MISENVWQTKQSQTKIKTQKQCTIVGVALMKTKALLCSFSLLLTFNIQNRSIRHCTSPCLYTRIVNKRLIYQQTTKESDAVFLMPWLTLLLIAAKVGLRNKISHRAYGQMTIFQRNRYTSSYQEWQQFRMKWVFLSLTPAQKNNSCCWRTDSLKVVSTLEQLSETVGGQTAVVVVSTPKKWVLEYKLSASCFNPCTICNRSPATCTERTNEIFLSLTQSNLS